MAASPCGWYFIVLPDDVGDLVVAAVVQLVHGVQDAALHGLEAVVEMRDRALEDHVAGVVEEPVAVELVHELRVRRGSRVAAWESWGEDESGTFSETWGKFRNLKLSAGGGGFQEAMRPTGPKTCRHSADLMVKLAVGRRALTLDGPRTRFAFLRGP